MIPSRSLRIARRRPPALRVRWYVAYPISRQLEEMMQERGVEVDHGANRARRLAKDFETLVTSSQAWFLLAMSFLLVRRIARGYEKAA